MGLDKFLKKLYEDEGNICANEVDYPNPISTPSPSLNWALNGGIRRGGLYCLEGPESSGKSFYALAIVAELLKMYPEGVAFWFDAEGTFSDHWLRILLPDPEDQKRLIIRTKSPMTGGQIFDYYKDTIMGYMQEGLDVVACVVDSVNAIIAPKEANLKSTEDHLMGDLSSYLPKALRLINGPSKPRLKEGFLGVPWFFISQVRDNMDPSAAYTGEKYVIPGGRAFKHFLDVEIEFTKIEAKKTKIFDSVKMNPDGTPIQIGHRVRARIKKNKLGPPNRKAEFDVLYDRGIINTRVEVANLALQLGLILKEGNTYMLDGKKIAVGLENTIDAINENEQLYTQVLDLVNSTNSNEEVNNA